MAGTLKIRLLDNDQQIAKKIYKEISKIIKPTMPKIATSTKITIQNKFRSLIKQDAVVRELEYGELYAQFGMTDISQRLDAIISQWISEIEVNPKPTRVTPKGVSGGFFINMINTDYTQVYNIPDARFITPKHGYMLEWLKWLLEMGGTSVVKGYDFKAKLGWGRTHGGIMVEGFGKGSWSVPPQYAGTRGDNFLTDIVDFFDDEKAGNHFMENIVKGEFAKAGLI